MRVRVGGLLVLTTVLVAFSGCTSGATPQFLSDCAPPVSARQAQAQEALPDFEQPMDILVTTQGRPLHRANVVVQWATSAEADMERAADRTVRFVTLTTGADGTASLTVPSDVYLLVTAAYPGLTEEWTPIMAPGNITSSVHLDLYPSYLVATYEGSISGTTTPADPVEARWSSHLIDILPDETYLQRTYAVTATIAWKQADTDIIDLDMAGGRAPDTINMTYGSDHTVAAGDPPTLRTTWSGAEISHWAELYVGPYAENGYVLSAPIDYTMLVEVDLARGDRVSRECVLYGELEAQQVFPAGAVIQAREGQAGISILSGLAGLVVGAGAMFLIRRK